MPAAWFSGGSILCMRTFKEGSKKALKDSFAQIKEALPGV